MLFATSLAALFSALIYAVLGGLIGLFGGLAVGSGVGYLISIAVGKWRHYRVRLMVVGLCVAGAIGCIAGLYLGFVHGWMKLFDH